MEMKKVTLVCYYDTTVGESGVICVSNTDDLTLTDGAKGSLRQWLDDFEEEEVEAAINEIDKGNVAYIGDFEIFTDFSWLY